MFLGESRSRMGDLRECSSFLSITEIELNNTLETDRFVASLYWQKVSMPMSVGWYHNDSTVETRDSFRRPWFFPLYANQRFSFIVLQSVLSLALVLRCRPSEMSVFCTDSAFTGRAVLRSFLLVELTISSHELKLLPLLAECIVSNKANPY